MNLKYLIFLILNVILLNVVLILIVTGLAFIPAVDQIDDLSFKDKIFRKFNSKSPTSGVKCGIANGGTITNSGNDGNGGSGSSNGGGCPPTRCGIP